eukprot:CAMPEP_0177599112 /NCGR_PEP_ID=MMETSP0419_2-20121207/12788_1 /TAXON_ID=582737 /ORGANISM="Tetraselmis sp., Strain GSL018" /LENGTH=417 /DNA_ID=CAMNT_0019091761 /DNA_START=304 /DNA_END=1557 /DNA_ORIENTATION=+
MVDSPSQTRVLGIVVQPRYLSFLPLVVLFCIVVRTQDINHSRRIQASLEHTLRSARHKNLSVLERFGVMDAPEGQGLQPQGMPVGPSAMTTLQRDPAGADQDEQRDPAGALEQPEAAAANGSPPVPEEVTFRVMSYNVWNFDDGKDWESLRLPAVARIIHGAQPVLVGLQELRTRDGDHQGKQLVSQLEALGSRYHFKFAVGMDYGDCQEGLGVLSRYPIEQSKVRRLPLGEGGDINGRICIMAQVTVPGVGPVQFFNTHLSYDSSQQVWNAAEVIKFVEERGFGGPQILVGDMNTLPGKVAPVAVFEHNKTWLSKNKPKRRGKWPSIKWSKLGAPFADAWVAVHPSTVFGGGCDSGSCTFSTMEPKTRCDYVLMRGNVSVRAAEILGQLEGKPGNATPPSDHLAVSVELAAPSGTR